MKTKQLNTYPFDGWDYTELADAWNLYIPDFEFHDEYPIIWFLDGVLDNHNKYNKSFVLSKVANDLRTYLSQLGEGDDIYNSVWHGMVEILSDHALIIMARKLIQMMWV